MASVLLSLLFLVSLSFRLAHGATGSHLFVFGDSYADTGNHNADDPRFSSSWKAPYGLTWPGKPSGRYSDGHVLTDFIVEILGTPSPMNYQAMKNEKGQVMSLSCGMNFAFGGSGVFETYGPQFPNISTQIDEFEQLLKGCCQDHNLPSSYVLFVNAGNDYAAHIRKTGDTKGLPLLIGKVVRQMIEDLQRLYNMGIRRFVVSNLQPMGCLPGVTSKTGFLACDGTANLATNLHNFLLSTGLLKLRILGAQVTLLDLNRAFLNVIHSPSVYGINPKPLQPCCLGINGEQASCGTVDGNGKPLFTICPNPSKAFFWDLAHPTEAGWKAIAQQLKDSFA